VTKSIFDLIGPLLLIAGGMLAAASLIVAQKPNAKDLIGKLQPYQASIGIALLVMGVWTLIRWISWFGPLLKAVPLFGICMIVNVVASILLGIMFGMPMLAKLSPAGAAKGEELGKKLAPFQTVIGVAGMAAGLVDILFYLELIK